MMRHIAALAALFIAGTAHAQSWEGKWKIVNGTCPDGIVVKVEEAAGTMTVRSMGAGSVPPSERVVQVAADGSGKLRYSSPVFGDMEMIVPPGKGKRELRIAQQVKGICQWKLE
jgi:hypothetical protein